MELETLTAFRRAPLGKCTAGESWLYFHPHADLAGFALWGSPTEDDVKRLVSAIRAMLGTPLHVTLVDVQRVVGGEPAGFRLLVEYIRKHGAEMSMSKLAIVRRGGFLGALAEGFFGVERAPCPVALFEDRAQALSWLGADPTFAGELAAHIARATSTSALLRDLRALLEREPETSSLAEAARALAVSARTLQRRLRDEDTTFSAEIAGARVRLAQRLLLHGDAKLTRIAHDVGCASSSHLVTLFRRVTGDSPLAWRKRELERRARG